VTSETSFTMYGSQLHCYRRLNSQKPREQQKTHKKPKPKSVSVRKKKNSREFSNPTRLY